MDSQTTNTDQEILFDLNFNDQVMDDRDSNLPDTIVLDSFFIDNHQPNDRIVILDPQLNLNGHEMFIEVQENVYNPNSQENQSYTKKGRSEKDKSLPSLLVKELRLNANRKKCPWCKRQM